MIDFNADQVTPTNTGQLIVAIDIAAFIDVATFKAKVDEVWETMKSSPLLPGFDEIRLPGERSARTAAERRAKGIPLHPELDRQLRALADELGIQPL